MIKYVDEEGLKIIAQIVAEKLSKKLDTLIEGVNIKTVNGESMLITDSDDDVTIEQPEADASLTDDEITQAFDQLWT